MQYKREYYNVDENFRFTFDKDISFINFYNNRKSIKKNFNIQFLNLNRLS